MSDLSSLHSEIDSRVASIRQQRPDWLCSKGCDACCKQLAALPRLTFAEWKLLHAGLAVLPSSQLEGIRHRLDALGTQPIAPVTCPILDPGTGACTVYVQRPVACRTYGFYAQRDKGLYCHEIEVRVADGTLADVVWGNHDVVDRQLAGSGENRALNEWFNVSE